MSLTRVTLETEASVLITYANGTTVDFPRVQMANTEWQFDDVDLPWGFERRIDLVRMQFHPMEPWRIKSPPPETKQEKRARLIREMYPR